MREPNERTRTQLEEDPTVQRAVVRSTEIIGETSTPAEVAAFDERGLWEANDSRGQRDCEVGFARI